MQKHPLPARRHPGGEAETRTEKKSPELLLTVPYQGTPRQTGKRWDVKASRRRIPGVTNLSIISFESSLVRVDAQSWELAQTTA
jgi:hypothetical protein